jgi:hypothetical protein
LTVFWQLEFDPHADKRRLPVLLPIPMKLHPSDSPSIFRCLLVPFLAAAVCFSGCQTVQEGYSPIPQRGGAFDGIHTTAVLSPHITLRSYSAGGVREERDEWNAAARDAIAHYIGGLQSNEFVLIDGLEKDPAFRDEITDIRDLYKTVELNAQVFGPILPAARQPDHYSLGSVDRILEAADADALLVIYGVDDIFTSGRQALVLIGIVAAAYLGGGVMGADAGESHISAALIARDGTILWHSMLSQDLISDLRTEDGVTKTLRRLFATFPLKPASETGES